MISEEETMMKIREAIEMDSDEDEYGKHIDWFKIEHTVTTITDEIQAELLTYAYKYAQDRKIGMRM